MKNKVLHKKAKPITTKNIRVSLKTKRANLEAVIPVLEVKTIAEVPVKVKLPRPVEQVEAPEEPSVEKAAAILKNIALNMKAKLMTLRNIKLASEGNPATSEAATPVPKAKIITEVPVIKEVNLPREVALAMEQERKGEVGI